MKKRLLLWMGALLALPAMAQETDVTSYIKNAGFDEDLTWQADGSKKEIVDQSKVLSNRTIAGVATDGSLYALVNSTTDKRREDGRTFEATNGFVGMIKGWEWVNLNDDSKPNERIESKACEWVYFGAIPYDLGTTAVPVADDGKTYLSAATPSEYFEAGKASLYLRAGWTNGFAYKQVVKLPCAKYRLEYWTININPKGTNTNATATDLSKITCRKDVFTDESGASLTATEWTKHEFEFTPTAEFTMQFGIKVSNNSSNDTPWVCIDGIKLYKIGDADPMELLQSDINDLEEQCSQLAGQASLLGFAGLASQIDDYGLEAFDELRAIDNPDNLEAAIKESKAEVQRFEQALATIESINAIMTKMDDLLQTTDYPGKQELTEAYNTLVNIKNGTLEEGADCAELMLSAVAAAKEALMAYFMSQKSTASEENPADFTIFIQHPWFINEEAEPTWDGSAWYFPKRYDGETGEDRYVKGSASSPDLNSTGWYVAGVSGGDQRLNWQCERSCWNAWNNNFTSTLAVAQDLKDLPNGYYTVSADLITQSGCLNDQHVFAQSVTTKNISAALTTDYWDTEEWETLKMTADQKVLVVDGSLTIGAEGTGTGSGATGWFLATNFRLNFLGEASDEVVTSALKETFNVKVAEAKELAAVMVFAGDKKALNDTIAKYEVAADKDAYITSIAALKAAIAEAKNSEAKYYDYNPTKETLDENPDLLKEKTMLWVQALVNGESVDGHNAFRDESKPIAQFALDYVNSYVACDTATYKQYDAVVDLLKNYVNTYIPVFEEALGIADVAKETGKNVLQQLLNSQKAALTSEMKDKATVDAYVSELKDMMQKVEKQNIYDNPNATDYTAYIKNPNAEAVTGWDITMGNGDGSGQKSGQWYNGSDTRYFDSYNSGGLTGFMATQLIKDLPNGTYTVGVYTRTPAEGAYVLYALQSDTTFVEIPINYAFDENGEPVLNEETSEQIIASDKYGPIWEEAAAAVKNGDFTSEQYETYNANNGLGRGWKHQEMTGIEVKNHELLIGTMAGTEASKTEKVFAGSWYSVGGWTLTLTAKGDNTGWAGPIESGINTIVIDNNITDGIYTLSGVKTNRLQQGVNIIITNGVVRKVMVK